MAKKISHRCHKELFYVVIITCVTSLFWESVCSSIICEWFVWKRICRLAFDFLVIFKRKGLIENSRYVWLMPTCWTILQYDDRFNAISPALGLDDDEWTFPCLVEWDRPALSKANKARGNNQLTANAVHNWRNGPCSIQRNEFLFKQEKKLIFWKQ